MSGSWREVLAGRVTAVAPYLLGAVLACDVEDRPVAVRLVEVEAYSGLGDDPGSHAHRGRTRRNASMFGRPGLAYVYFTYGLHWCLNVGCAPEGTASGVLLRAATVVDGLDTARERRGGSVDRDLCRGPARLARTLGVDGTLDGTDLLDAGSRLRLLGAPPAHPAAFASGPRVGVPGAGAPTPWRFWLPDEPAVSAYRPAQPRRRRAAASGRLGASPTPDGSRP